jgi:uncharacterized protein (TIGR03067 family)
MSIAICLAIGLLLGADAVNAEETLQGTWTLSSGESNGKALTKEQLKDGKLVIKKDNYSVTIEGAEAITGEQKLDATAKPKTIDIKDSSGANKGKTCLGIYEVKGDELRVAFAAPGKDRPTKFSTKADSGQWMHVWKRVKE